MNNRFLATAAAVLLVTVAVQSVLLWRQGEPERQPASTPANATGRLAPEAIKARLKKGFGKAEAITYEPETGLYRVQLGGQLVYVTPDGEHLISGSVYDIATRENLTERAMTGLRRDILAGIDPDDAIIFAPKGETKHVVWVFTDVTCPYCRKFHRQIDAYTQRGIEVRYLAFPRGGPGSRGWQLAQSVWCAADRHAAMTQAKATQTAVGSGDCDNPVADEYKAGHEVGLRGTPMLIATDGRVLGGYMSPAELDHALSAGG